MSEPTAVAPVTWINRKRFRELAGLDQRQLGNLLQSPPPDFPLPRRFSRKATVWNLAEVEAWLRAVDLRSGRLKGGETSAA
ncbi:MAG TPA: hypothetical protein VEL76_26160 [Gemmataceae bacterium]|nr:hypothetical protein [Gemmataceae bacterium]